MKNKIFALAVVVILIVSALSVAVLWEGGPGIEFEGEDVAQPEYNEHLAHVSVNNDSIVYVYDSEPGVLNYSVGSFIVGTTGYGYLRKITDIEQEGNTVVVSTENAVLTDVVEEGELDVNQTIPLDSNLTRAGFTLPLDYTLFSSEKNGTTTTVRVFGEIAFDTGLVFKVSVKNFKLKHLEFYVEASCSYSLGFEATHSISLEKELEIFSKVLTPITFSIAFIPVVITPTISFSVGTTLELAASMTTSVGGSITARGGLMYDSGSWSPISELERESYFDPPSFDLTADATVYAITPSMSFLLYGLVGPTFELKPYVTLHVAPFENPWWSLYLGLTGSAGVEFSVLSKEIASYTFDIFDMQWLLAEAPMKYEPEAPENLAVVPGKGQATLTWDPPDDDGGSEITGYKVYAGTASGMETYRATVTETLYTHAGLMSNRTYYYRVAAVNAIGTGPLCDEASARTFGSPYRVTGLSAESGNRIIDLTWTAPSHDGGSPITTYRVYGGTSSGSKALVALATVTSCSCTGLTPGLTYYYDVTAMNEVGEGPASAEASALVFDFPGAPTGLALTPGDGQIELAWTAPSDDGGTAVTRYNVYRGNATAAETFLVGLGNVTDYLDSGLANGQDYYYQVAAVSAVGEGARSGEAFATPSPTLYPPTEPRNLVLTPGHQNISLAWDVPMNNGGSAITGYTVYRGDAPGNEVFLAALGNVLSYQDPVLPDGQTYFYQVSASNAVGEGPRCAEQSATTFYAPAAPENLTATAGHKCVVLAWQQPADTGGTNLTGYNIYRGTVSGGEVFLTTLGVVTSYVDPGLTIGQEYYYQISALNVAGESPLTGEASAIPTHPVHNLDSDLSFDSIQAAIDDAGTLDGHTLTVSAGTFYENVVVDKSLTLIGAGREYTTIDVNGTGYAMVVTADWVNVTGFTVMNASAWDNVGLHLDNVDNCNISGNNLSFNSYGLFLEYSNYSSIHDNLITLNSIFGIIMSHSHNNTLSHNTVALTLYDEGGDSVLLINSDDNLFTHNTVTNNSAPNAVVIENSHNNRIQQNTITHNEGAGIRLSFGASSNNIIQDNVVTNNDYGFSFVGAYNNLIQNNEVSNNPRGFSISDSCNNTFVGNNITGCTNYGFYMYVFWGPIIDNKIYFNNFLFNAPSQAYDESGTTMWDTGCPLGGNYWTDYAGSDANGDGIGDTPYVIPGGGGAQDNYPLMYPYL